MLLVDEESLNKFIKSLTFAIGKEEFFRLNSELWSFRAASVLEDKDYSSEIRLIKSALNKNMYTTGPRGDPSPAPTIHRTLKSIDTGKPLEHSRRKLEKIKI